MTRVQVLDHKLSLGVDELSDLQTIMDINTGMYMHALLIVVWIIFNCNIYFSLRGEVCNIAKLI